MNAIECLIRLRELCEQGLGAMRVECRNAAGDLVCVESINISESHSVVGIEIIEISGG